IVKDDDRADHASLAVADRCRRLLDRDLLAGSGDEHRMIRSHARLAAAERAHQRILDRLARDLVDEIQHIAQGAAARLIQAPSREALGDGIDVLDAALGVGADHRIADRLERHLRPLLLGEDSLLGALSFGDVRNSSLVTYYAV